MTKKEFKKESIEIKVLKITIIVLTTVLSIMLVFASGLSSLSEDLSELYIMLVLFLMVFGPFIIYQVYKYIHILRNFDNYEFITVEFKEMHPGLKGVVYFDVDVTIDNKKHKVSTRSIFSSNVFDMIHPSFEDYLNKFVKVAVNKKTIEVVVIKPID